MTMTHTSKRLLVQNVFPSDRFSRTGASLISFLSRSSEHISRIPRSTEEEDLWNVTHRRHHHGWPSGALTNFDVHLQNQLPNTTLFWDTGYTAIVNATPTNLDNVTADEDHRNWAVLVPVGVVLSVLCALTFVGNAMVLHAIRTEKRLQTVSNMFIMSLAIADLTVGLFVMPISTAYIMTEKWLFKLTVCKMWLSVDYTASTASIFNLFILSLDRYWSITSPLKYLKKRTKKRALIMISIVWLTSALWIVPILGWHHFTNDGVRRIPSDVCDTEFAHDRIVKVTTAIFNFYIPLAMMISVYGKIFHEIRQRSKFDIGIRNTGGNGKQDGASDSFGDYDKKASGEGGEDDDDDDDATPDGQNIIMSREEIEYQECPSSPKLSAGQYTNLTLLDVTSSPRLALQHFDNIKVTIEYVYDSSDEERIATAQSPLMAKHVKRERLQKETSLSTSDKGSTNSAHSSMLNNAVENPLYSKSQKLKRLKSDGKSGKLQATPPEQKRGAARKTLSNKSNKGSSKKSNSSMGSKLSSKFIKSSRIPRIPFGLKRKVCKSPNSALRREKKAAKQLGVIMGAFVLCWLPYFVFFMVVAFCDDCISDDLYMASIWLGYFNSTLNPFLYPLCNANFKRAFKRMLMCRDSKADSAYSRACELSQGYTGRITR